VVDIFKITQLKNLSENKIYDVAIVGGGLAGLALSIQCAKAGYATILFEKERYPFHKVCGEYISMESWAFVEGLGLPLSKMNLPIIKNLLITAPNGKKIEGKLPLGGFGISRYLIDYELYKIAKALGVHIEEAVKVDDVQFENDLFTLNATNVIVQAKIAAGSFGKRSNLDVKWKRNFVFQKKNKLNNYIGVKYHIKTSWPNDLIALHNFENGYCGISQIEEGKHCLCYLTTAENLKKSGNAIEALEVNFLQANPHLKSILQDAQKLYTEPLTIAQISFDKKAQVENHMLMIGDAAGMITPLCGNGMSMALHGSKLAFEAIDLFLAKKINRTALELAYTRTWEKQFSKRLVAGRIIQTLFGKKWVTNLLITTVKPFPFLLNYLIRQTHGEAF
jgi:menaquinone-9 beta-reductase